MPLSLMKSHVAPVHKPHVLSALRMMNCCRSANRCRRPTELSLSFTQSQTGRDADDKVCRLKWFSSQAQHRDTKAEAASLTVGPHAHSTSLSVKYERPGKRLQSDRLWSTLVKADPLSAAHRYSISVSSGYWPPLVSISRKSFWKCSGCRNYRS